MLLQYNIVTLAILYHIYHSNSLWQQGLKLKDKKGELISNCELM